MADRRIDDERRRPLQALMQPAGPIVVRHGPDQHGPGNISVAAVQRDRLAERGTGLKDVPHRVLTYSQLRNIRPMADRREPSHTVELHLTGNMERYMWSFDGVKYPADTLKIDKSFIDHIPDNASGQLIVNAVIGLGAQFGLELVAEGIETQEQLDYLQERNVQCGQGFLVSRPLPEQEFIQAMTNGLSIQE